MKTVREWIEAGHLESGFYLIEKSLTKITPKAVGIECPKFNAAGNIIQAIAWLPKSKIKFVINDHYTDTIGQKMILVPCWLVKKKEAEGFIFG